MRRKYAKWLLPLCLLGCRAAAAEEPPAPPAAATAQAGAIGESTRQWLESQRQGKQAAARPQPLSGPVQEQIYERYRKSFSHPVPERFESERANSSGSTPR